MTEYTDKLLFPDHACTNFKTQFPMNTEIEKNYALLSEASRRLSTNKKTAGVPIVDVMKYFGITESDLAESENLEIE